MGSTMFEGGSITKSLQMNQVKLPQNKITFTYKEFTKCYKVYNMYKRYKDIQIKYKIHQCKWDKQEPSMPQ